MQIILLFILLLLLLFLRIWYSEYIVADVDFVYATVEDKVAVVVVADHIVFFIWLLFVVDIAYRTVRAIVADCKPTVVGIVVIYYINSSIVVVALWWWVWSYEVNL